MDRLIFSCIFLGVAVLTLLERFFPDQKLPKVPNWWFRVFFLQSLVLLTITFGLNGIENQLMKFRLVDGSTWFSPFWGGVVSYLSSSFIFYWWHRARHEIQLFWRVFHQIHHSPSRVQAVTAFYVHPMEAVASSLINSVWVLIFLGMTPESLVWNAAWMASIGIFYHMNLKTPDWIGYFVQRPEMHKYHHLMGAHSHNYSDLPIWDILFGTFKNPPAFEGECGFGDLKELRFRELLCMKAIS